MMRMSNEILRVGFSTNDEVMLEGHFGHCEKFAIYTIENGKVFTLDENGEKKSAATGLSLPYAGWKIQYQR